MASKYQKLLDKHVVVFGGTSGIGFGVAEASLASGAQVTVSSSNQSRVDAVVEKLKSDFPDRKVAGFTCDLSKPTVEQDLEALFSKIGKVDHIVYSAGDSTATATVQEITYDKIVAAGQVRFVAALLAAKVGSKHLNPGPQSSITFTSGLLSQKPRPQYTILAGYGAGLHGLTRNLALDLKPIRVNLVSPGVVDTELLESALGQEVKKNYLEGIARQVPTGRVAQPADVAEAYLFLMKDPSVTGTVVDTNSGALLI